VSDQEPFRFDVVGFGSLNVDFIVPVLGLRTEEAEDLERGFERGKERETSDHEAFLSHLAKVRGTAKKVVPAHGGSSFNVVRALRALDVGLRIGYAGPQGVDIASDLQPHRKRLTELDINADGVVGHEHHCGKCISLVREDRRSLDTYYDDRFPQVVVEHLDDLAAYLAGARIVHVTSLFGPDGPPAVARLMDATIERNPQVRFSVDPGASWADRAETDPHLQSILERASLIFVNPEEFAALGRPCSDDDAAGQIFERFGHSSTLLLLKRWNESVLYRWGEAKPEPLNIAQHVLPRVQIADSTGAGDVFAAGVLAGLLSPEAQEANAVRLGLDAARHKLQRVADEGYETLHQVVTRRSRDPKPTVFISHASANRQVAEDLRDLLVYGAGMRLDSIFCTSLDVHGIPAGDPTVATILRKLQEAHIVIFLLSEEFLASRFCLYEYGAAWGLGRSPYPLRVPPLEAERFDDLLRGNEAPPITSRPALDALRDRVGDLLAGEALAGSTAAWDHALEQFERKVKLAPSDEGGG
jgi:sugar/nucleoside kinase (ribokinase family)